MIDIETGRADESAQFDVIDLAATVQQTSRKMGIFPYCLLEGPLLQQHSARLC